MVLPSRSSGDPGFAAFNRPSTGNLGPSSPPPPPQTNPLGTSTRTMTIPRPDSIESTGLDIAVIADLCLKIIYFNSYITAQDLSAQVKLPFYNIIDKVIALLKKEQLIETTGSASAFGGERGYQYTITNKGQNRSEQLLDRSGYAGPAPVVLDEYRRRVMQQSATGKLIGPEEVKQSLGHLVIDERMHNLVGVAVNSGRSMFLFGNPGNGKTVIAESVSNMLGGAVWIPHAVMIGGQIIKVYDEYNHKPIAMDDEKQDNRWVLCERPSIVVGGELTLPSLDLVYDPVAKFYEAPFQMKANGGMFLIDDFGRQQMRPQELLNRWIVPLEKRIDFLTTVTGKKVEVPFDILIVFSTNLNPADLVDEAFLRRIQSKIEVSNPSMEQYREIFWRTCKQLEIPYTDEGLVYLLREYYMKPKRQLRSCHPRDILKQLVGISRYFSRAPELDQQLIDLACETYFVDLAGEEIIADSGF